MQPIMLADFDVPAPALPEPPKVRVSGVWQEGCRPLRAIHTGTDSPNANEIAILEQTKNGWEYKIFLEEKEFAKEYPGFPGWPSPTEHYAGMRVELDDYQESIGQLEAELSTLRARVGEIGEKIESYSSGFTITAAADRCPPLDTMRGIAKELRALAQGSQPDARTEQIAALTAERDEYKAEAERLRGEYGKLVDTLAAKQKEIDTATKANAQFSRRWDEQCATLEKFSAERYRLTDELASANDTIDGLQTEMAIALDAAKTIIGALGPHGAIAGCEVCDKPIYDDDDYLTNDESQYFHRACVPPEEIAQGEEDSDEETIDLTPPTTCPLRITLKLDGSTVSGKVLEQAEGLRAESGSTKQLAKFNGFELHSEGEPALYGNALYIRGSHKKGDDKPFSREYPTLPEARRVYRAICECVAKIGGKVEHEFADGPPPGDGPFVVKAEHFGGELVRWFSGNSALTKNGSRMGYREEYVCHRPATDAEIKAGKVIENG